MYLMLLLSKRNIYEREDTDYFDRMYHRNDKNIGNWVLFYRFANSVIQIAAVLFTFF